MYFFTSDIAEGEAMGYAGIPSTTSATEEVQKTRDHEWINEWKNKGYDTTSWDLEQRPERVTSMPGTALKENALGWLIAARSGPRPLLQTTMQIWTK